MNRQTVTPPGKPPTISESALVRGRRRAVTMQPTEAFELDGRAVREMCEADPILGHELTRRFMPVVVHRLQATRIRLLDVYGHPEIAP